MGRVARSATARPQKSVGPLADPERHWTGIYRARRSDLLSWYQVRPTLSLELIEGTGAGTDARILDVGGGASVLVDFLLDLGHRHLGVLDIAPDALRVSQERLGERSAEVEWLVSDVLKYRSARPWDVWHDRALFHFLTDENDRTDYLASLERNLSAGGHVVVATFGPDAPPRCSGLSVQRYDETELAETIGPNYVMRESRHEVHVTPDGTRQAFTFVRLQRVT